MTTIPGSSDRRGNPSGEASVLEEVQGLGNLSPELGTGSGKIWTWTCLTLWSTIEKRNMSGRLASAREKRKCRGGRSGLTVTDGVLGFQWRRGGSISRQPGGGSG
jgi:hypothetical protein